MSSNGSVLRIVDTAELDGEIRTCQSLRSVEGKAIDGMLSDSARSRSGATRKGSGNQ